MQNFINTSIVNIRKSLRKGRAIFFIGSGVSMNSGLPSWSQLVKILASKIDIDVENISTDDYLKIPQYYCNERGLKEYYDILLSIFTDSYAPNHIHDVIFELNPWHIITTNFDNLLEKKLLEKGAMYHIVKENRDVSYGSSNRMLIKMYGDVSSFNVVFKEEDYLSYTKNFQLIDNVVKTLLLSYTTIFIGFSAEDPNFKLIYQWVKNELGDHLNESYLVDTSKTYNKIIFDYYKARGIKILYVKELLKEDEDVADCFRKISKSSQYESISDVNGQLLFSFLTYIKDGYGQAPDDIIEEIYSKLKPLDYFNVLLPDMIILSLGDGLIYNYKKDESLYISQKSVFYDFFSNLFTEPTIRKSVLKSNITKISSICRILKKAGIKSIFIEIDQKGFSFNISNRFKPSQSASDDFLNAVLEFDSEAFKNIANEQPYFPPNLDQSQYELRKAYCHYLTGEYLSAYAILKGLSLSSFQTNNYILLCICEFNKSLLSPYIKMTCSKNKRLWDELDAINFEEVLLKIPPHQRHISSILKRIIDFDFANGYAVDVSEQYRRIADQRRCIEDGGASFNDALFKAFGSTTNFFLFSTMNFLMTDSYSNCIRIYKSFVQSVFARYGTRPIPGSGALYNAMQQAPMKIDTFTLYFAVKYYKFPELLSIIKENRIHELFVEDGVVEALLKMMTNLVKIKLSIFMSSDPVFNIFYLLSLIKYKTNAFERALSIALQHPSIHLEYERINKILYSYWRNNRDSIDRTALFSAVNKLLKALLTTSIKSIDWLNFHILLTNIFSIIKENGDAFPATFDSIPTLLAFTRNKITNSILDGYEIFAKIVIPLYDLCDSNTKKEICALIDIAIEPRENIGLQQRTNIILKAYISNISPGSNWESILNDFTDSVSFPLKDDERSAIANIAILHSSGKISLSQESITKIRSLDDFSDFMLNKDEFDFSKFNFEWIHFIKTDMLESLLCKPAFHDLVKNMLTDKLSDINDNSQMLKIVKSLFALLKKQC